MTEKVKSWVITALKIALAGSLIWWLLESGRFDFRRLTQALAPEVLAGGMVLLLLSLGLASERWRFLLRARGFEVSPLGGLRYTLIGAFFNFVIPGGVGGDVVKSFYVARDNPHSRMRAVLTIAMDRLLGLFSMLGMALLVMLWDWKDVSSKSELLSIFKILLLLFLGFMLGWCFVFSRRLYGSGLLQKILSFAPKSQRLLSLYNSFSDYRHHKSLFFRSVAISFCAQFLAVLFFIFVGNAFGFKGISPHIYFFVVPIGFM
ncbi:MAG: lysylphosphatidylglycerol synthase transmembrane domain-containing protein, partial [Bdellovibrio sp.]